MRTQGVMVENTTRAFGSPLRYIQGAGEFGNMPEYTSKFGTACFLVDGFLYDGVKGRLESIYAGKQNGQISVKFGGECCDSEVERVKSEALKAKAGVIIGMGGGKTLDTAKLCANEMKLPVIIVPTSAASDAPVSEIAIVYKEDGEYIGSRKMDHNSELVLVDSEIIAKAPIRLFKAGIADALATLFEAEANADADTPNYVGAGHRRCLAGMAIAAMCRKTLMADARSAVMALEAGAITEAVDNVIEANILLSGLGFQNTGCACAHGIHSGLTALPSTHKYLHGEKVAFGIVVQMVLENRPHDEVDEIMTLMTDIGLPVTLKQLDVETTEENIAAVAKKTFDGPLVHHEPFKVTLSSLTGAILTADALGRSYLDKKC